MLIPTFEQNLIREGFTRVVGIDEVGRGCWAGPVTVGAFVWTLEHQVVPEVDDSKKVPPTKRSMISSQLAQSEHYIFNASVTEIDAAGVGKAVTKLVHDALEQLTNQETYFIVDGYFPTLKNIRNLLLVPKADATYYSVAAAAILAKVHRDQLMTELDKEHQGYGFIDHKGYGTKAHREALVRLGCSPIHRQSYAPIQNLAKLIRG